MKQLIVCAWLLISVSASADSVESNNRVSFSASASREVSTDLLVVRLFVQHEARTQRKAADEVNKVMAWAMEKVKADDAVKGQTMDYRTHPVYDQRKVRAWQVRQTLRLRSADAAAVTALLAELQTRMGIESVSREISNERRKQIEHELTADAIASFLSQAKLIATAFGRSEFELISSHINTSGSGGPRPMTLQSRAMSVAAEVAAPTIEGGEQTVNVQINGTVELSER